MILDKYVSILVTSRYVSYYNDLGYNARIGEILDVDIKDLKPHSRQKVNVQCDYCGNVLIKEYRRANKEKYCCDVCRGILTAKEYL
jgi:formylmethanofuran dehydrogenase subunit E